MKRKQLIIQNLDHVNVQLPNGVANHPRNSPSNIQVSSQDTEGVNSTISFKSYQLLYALEIAEEYEQALAVNSLEKLNKLFDKILNLAD